VHRPQQRGLVRRCRLELRGHPSAVEADHAVADEWDLGQLAREEQHGRALARKAPVRKAPPRRTGPLDKFLIGQLEALEAEKITYTRQAASLKAEADLLAAEREPGDVQFDEESGEGDTLAVERERDLALSAQARAAIEEIDHALGKIDEGTYGICEVSGLPIPRERLKAIPWARVRVEYKAGGLSSRH